MKSHRSVLLAVGIVLCGFPSSTLRAQIRVQERAMNPGVGQTVSFQGLSVDNYGAYFDETRNRIVVSTLDGLKEWEPGGVCRTVPFPVPTPNAAICRYPLDPGAGLVWSVPLGTWKYKQGTWTQLAPPNFPRIPNPTYHGATIVFDAQKSEAILFVDYANFQGSYYRFSNGTWSAIPATPSDDIGTTLVYDEARKYVMALSRSTCHAWQGSAWVPLPMPPSTIPLLRHRSLAFDRKRKTVVCFGGSDFRSPVSNLSDEVCTWDGVRWTQVARQGTWVTPRAYGTFVYDDLSQRCLLFGGLAHQVITTYEDVWAFDGTQWTDLSTSVTRPSARTDAMLGEDRSRGSILFGGRDAANVAKNDTWLWDGGTWSQLALPQVPEARSGGALVRAGDDRCVLFGGMSASQQPLSDSWVITPSGGWLLLPVTTRPAARFHHAMACDVAGGNRVHVFGGWNGSNVLGDLSWLDESGFPVRWRALPSGPPARRAHAMTCDETRRRLVVFGGMDQAGVPFGDTWEFDLVNQTWSQLQPVHRPSPRIHAGFAFDVIKDRAVLVGGHAPNGGGALDEIWEWDGVDWTRRIPETASFAAIEKAATCYDRYTHRVVMFGGTSANGKPSEFTWEVQEHLGKPALGQGHPIDLDVLRVPVVGSARIPFRVAVPSPAGTAAVLLDLQRAPQPWITYGPPFFCSTQPLHVQPTLVLPVSGSPGVLNLDLPDALGGNYLGFQGVSVFGSCLNATDAWYVKVGYRP